jgi:chromate transporter
MLKEALNMDKETNKVSLFSLFITFAQVGVMTFGGGYAMLPILQREVVESKKWCTEDELMDYFAVGQCTPGIIAVNTATFIGYKKRGNLGGLMGTLGMIFPGLVIISLISYVLDAFESNRYVQMSLAGIRVAVCALIIVAIMKLSKKSIIDLPTAIIAFGIFFTMLFYSISPVIFVIIGIVLGLFLSIMKERRSKI